MQKGYLKYSPKWSLSQNLLLSKSNSIPNIHKHANFGCQKIPPLPKFMSFGSERSRRTSKVRDQILTGCKTYFNHSDIFSQHLRETLCFNNIFHIPIFFICINTLTRFLNILQKAVLVGAICIQGQLHFSSTTIVIISFQLFRFSLAIVTVLLQPNFKSAVA